MKITQKILVYFLLFGLCVALIFPFYANLFVVWKSGMLLFFVFGCVCAGVVVGIGNFIIFKKMLRRYINILSEKLSIESTMLKNQSENVGAQIHQMDTTFHDLLSGVEDHTRYISDSNGVIMKVINQIIDISSQAKKSDERIQTSKNIVTNSMSISTNAEKNLIDIDKAIKLSIQLVTSISDRVKTMDEMVDSINKIAAKTNLLSLNAAIEAARAGDTGKGFAVVAAEVRKLASNSQNSSVEISNIIEKIQSETKTAKDEIEKETEKLKKSIAVIQEALASRVQLSELATSSSRSVSKISTSAIELSANSEIVLGNFESIYKISEDNQRSLTESVLVFDDIRDKFKELNKTSQSLNRVILDLNQLVE